MVTVAKWERVTMVTVYKVEEGNHGNSSQSGRGLPW